jgi:hypothetical protein
MQSVDIEVIQKNFQKLLHSIGKKVDIMHKKVLVAFFNPKGMTS